MAKHNPVKFAKKTGGNYDLLSAALEGADNKFKTGSIVKGTIREIRGNEVLVDIGYKGPAFLPASEFKDVEPKVGDQYDMVIVALERDDGMLELSKSRADEIIRWEAFTARYKEGDTLIGKVTSHVHGGFTVVTDGVSAFLPTSHVDIDPVRDPESFIGQEIEVKLIKINQERCNPVISRRELLEERQADQKRELLSTIEIGQVRTGRVKNITDFGAFIDLNGLDGLLHITDLSWGRVKHPSEIVKVGQELEVKILDVDLQRERVSLGLKQIQPNPWDDIESRYPVGSRVKGTVASVAAYGAFIQLEPGIEGLVHVSEFSWTKRIARASDMLTQGQEIEVVVLSVNKEDQKIGLGIKQTQANPWDTIKDRYPVGSRISGKVRNFTSYGAFVEIEDGIDGMIHVSDMSWTRKINHPSEMLQKGQDVEAVVLEIDSANQRISLGLKQASSDPWSTISSRYAIGQIVKGKVTKIASFGAFIGLEDGVDGLVHISQLSDEHVEKVKDVVNIGQEVEARIVKIDSAERRIGLSIKAVGMSENEIADLTKELNQQSTNLKPGENIVGLAAAFEDAFAQSGEDWQPGADK